MGMAASQARFLGLTARKTNVEYQGQQVNQQRASLANESAGLFNQMTGLKVPLPPSATNFYSSRYVFQGVDSTDYSITAINPSSMGNSGEYDVTIQYKVDQKVGFCRSDLASTVKTPYSETTDADGKVTAVQGGLEINSKTYNARMATAQEPALIAVIAALGEQNITKTAEDFVAFSNSETGLTYYVLKDDVKNRATGSADMTPLHFANDKTVTKTTTASASFIQDTTNTERYAKITLSNLDPEVAAAMGFNQGSKETFDLDIRQIQDDAAYEEAMKDYEFQKMLYERSIQDINAKTEVIQQQDKGLELKLKQLDTEQKALQTEMEAVQKVIQKNVETTFKTFG